MADACKHAGTRETGGMLFGEHVAEDQFRVLEATVASVGSVASFLRSLVGGLAKLDAFFRRTDRDYRRFNYLGEWHSHPSFALLPSGTDDHSMFDIVTDPATGARFAVSIIVKLKDQRLEAEAFVYFPSRVREQAKLIMS